MRFDSERIVHRFGFVVDMADDDDAFGRPEKGIDFSSVYWWEYFTFREHHLHPSSNHFYSKIKIKIKKQNVIVKKWKLFIKTKIKLKKLKLRVVCLLSKYDIQQL